MANKRRFLGDPDAAYDQQFGQHYVDSGQVDKILTRDISIIYGAKGMGKTALRRALTELKGNHYYSTKTIDMDAISFSQFYNSLTKLQKTAKKEVSRLAQKTWQNVLINYAIEALVEKLPEGDILRDDIKAALSKEGFGEKGTNIRLLGQVQRIFDRIVDACSEDNAPSKESLLGLTEEQLKALDTYPPSSSLLESVLKRVVNRVIESRKKILVCVDGFDTIVEHSAESRMVIFAGLVDAVQKPPRSLLIKEAFSFKAFLPAELTSGAHAAIWDSDKYIGTTDYVRWTREDFEKFIIKRLQIHSRIKSNVFAHIWEECLPKKVFNPTHKIEEDTMDYILRHTLYRPRQFLCHLQLILDDWDARSNAFRVDPTFIPQTVAKANKELATSVVNQLEVENSGISNLLASLNGRPSTMEVTVLLDRIKRVLGLEDQSEIHLLFDRLFLFGVLGFARREAITKGASRSNFRFGFIGDQIKGKASAIVDPGDIVAISPMFREYSGSAPSEYGAIIPIAPDAIEFP